MALSGDSQPHLTTIADFIAKMSEYVAPLFAQVLVICEREKLIDRSLFAINGVKLPSNAAKSKSGTRADYQKQLDKMEAKVKVMLERHETADQNLFSEAETHKIDRLKNEAQKLREWLNRNPKDREGSRSSMVLSNRTDNVKMCVSQLNEYLTGWISFFGICTQEVESKLRRRDAHIRRRLRAIPA